MISNEPLEQQLFQADRPKIMTIGSENQNCSNPESNAVETTKPIISDLDHRMLFIISSYIKKLPDNKTRKQLARLLINTIIKSANL
jgi:hypothetical protein